jgi:hypothetical protein
MIAEGMLRPNARAASRSTTIRRLDAAWNGRSAGFSPRITRIISVVVEAQAEGQRDAGVVRIGAHQGQAELPCGLDHGRKPAPDHHARKLEDTTDTLGLERLDPRRDVAGRGAGDRDEHDPELIRHVAGHLQVELRERIGRVIERSPGFDRGEGFPGQREGRIHRERDVGAGDVRLVVRGRGPGSDEVRIGHGGEHDRLAADHPERGLGGHRGHGRHVIHAALLELVHDEHQGGDVALGVALEDPEGRVANVARVGERLEEPVAGLIERGAGGDLGEPDGRLLATAQLAAGSTE